MCENLRQCLKWPHPFICRSRVKWPIMQIAASCDLQIDREMTPGPLKRRILSYDRWRRSWDLPNPAICRILRFADRPWNANQPRNAKSPETSHPLIWCFRAWSVTEDGAFQRMERSMERYRGWSVSKDRAFLGWLAITVDLQFRECGIKNNSRLIYAIGMQNTATSRIKQVDN